ncbi:MAG: HAMP domain-containing histidine kinase [Candidatus Schekmanbacteria bacterium]|nr:HAMP domain-containing histidine kinase [Candidatus Schekmanbacteria bacterium]
MQEHIEHPVGQRDDVLSLLSKIAGFIFETENPLSHAYEIVRQTAKSQDADISTLFVVEQNTLVLMGGVAFLRGEEIALPKEKHSYPLKWDVKTADDMKDGGLTAFVAVSGTPLNISSLEDLVSYSCHHGGWDEYIYPDPDSIKNSETGFGCMYAVPIKRSREGSQKDTVLGVFKIERRRNRPPFSEQDKKIFDLVAAHLSLLLQTYYRVQNRVFSDVAHAIGGGLGRSVTILTMCQEVIKNSNTDPYQAFEYLKTTLPNSIAMLNKAIERLVSVLDAARDPNKITHESIQCLWDLVRTEVELKSNLELNKTKCLISVNPPMTMETTLRLPCIQYHDLSSILGNILDNAVRHSGTSIPILIRLYEENSGEKSYLIFEVLDNGKGIRPEVIKEVENTEYGEVFHLPGTAVVGSGTGLRRVYGLAKLNKWVVKCAVYNGTTFRITTPDFRL